MPEMNNTVESGSLLEPIKKSDYTHNVSQQFNKFDLCRQREYQLIQYCYDENIKSFATKTEYATNRSNKSLNESKIINNVH